MFKIISLLLEISAHFKPALWVSLAFVAIEDTRLKLGCQSSKASYLWTFPHPMFSDHSAQETRRTLGLTSTWPVWQVCPPLGPGL